MCIRDRTLSEHKMNNLGVHLNDNEILSTSGKNDSISNAFTAYAGFRLESGLKNSRGEGITSQDGSLTREEWKELTRFAAEKGVQVIPEIDTPAHSLALTRIFPEYALADEPDNVDQLDLDVYKRQPWPNGRRSAAPIRKRFSPMNWINRRYQETTLIFRISK